MTDIPGQCSRCDKPRETAARYCNACHAANMREWRKAHPLTGEQLIRQRARNYARVYLRRGKIMREPCHCGAPAQMHHEDYSQPLLVQWLCRKHHLAHHQNVTHETMANT